MSDEDNEFNDIDIETDEDDDYDSTQGEPSNSTQNYSQAAKRAHHNALERRRRDHIKDSFSSLRHQVPALQDEKVASRAHILKKTADYIHFMLGENLKHQQEMEKLAMQNDLLELQIRKLEKSENITAVSCASAKTESVGIDTGSESEFSDNSESD